MKFYNVKARKSVEVADSKCTKSKVTRKDGKFSYMVKAVGDDGAKLTTFVNEAAYKALKCKEA